MHHSMMALFKLTAFAISVSTIVSAQLTPAPTPDVPTPAPTFSTVDKSTQLTVMIIYFIVLLVCLGLVGCMAKSCECCKRLLILTIGCKSCEQCSCKKTRTSSALKERDVCFKCFSPCSFFPFGEPGGEMWTLQRQFFLLSWKRMLENTRNIGALVIYFCLPIVSLVVIKILYGMFSGFSNFDSSGIIEVFATPLMFIVVVQLTTTSVVMEKASKLLESMRIMSLRELPYWSSYVMVDAIVQGAILATLMTAVSAALELYWVGGEGHEGRGSSNYGELLVLLYLSIIALTITSFTISSCFDNTQAASMFTFFFLVGSVVIFFVLALTVPEAFDSATEQTLWCLIPSMALQIGLMTKFNVNVETGDGMFGFTQKDDTIEFSSILGMLVLDMGLYALLAWYLGQIVPSKFGITKSPWFLFQPSYWGCCSQQKVDAAEIDRDNVEMEGAPDGPGTAGDASVVVDCLRKTFGSSFVAVNDLSFNIYEGQCFALLGSNGAGKTTTINMLTGIFAPDASSGDVTIYGNSIKTDIALVRRKLGVCPQHDILFDQLTTREHIIFFSLLKGGCLTFDEAEAEADVLLKDFHLEERTSHMGNELSGGMRRKVSTAIAVCGGSSFIVLDEPTAGMDPIARRELWDLLLNLRKGRTILLTTHYMEEADVLGDSIAIMNRGKLQCMGSSDSLKHQYGSGYKVFATMQDGALVEDEEEEGPHGGGGERALKNLASTALASHPLVVKLVEFAAHHVPGATLRVSESSAASICLILPFSSSDYFVSFFNAFDEHKDDFLVTGYGLSMTSLEEVFLKCGGDKDLDNAKASGELEKDERDILAIKNKKDSQDDGEGERVPLEDMISRQIHGLWVKRMSVAMNDTRATVPLLGFPLAVGLTGLLLNIFGVLGDPGDDISTIVMAVVIAAGFLPAVSMFTEAVVSERTTSLRNVLTVMGCDPLSYWVGSFCGDFTLMMVPSLLLYVCAVICALVPPVSGETGDDDYLVPLIDNGLFLWLLVLSSAHIITFCYFISFLFDSPKVAIASTPFFVIVLLFLPPVFVALFWYGMGPKGVDVVYFSDSAVFLNMLRGIAVCSPQGALAIGIMASADACVNVTEENCVVPAYWEVMVIMFGEVVLFAFCTYLIDRRSFLPLKEQTWDLSDAEVTALDSDVAAERAAVLASGVSSYGLRLANLRKVFPAKGASEKPVVADKSISLGLPRGELFGLLGPNGAGKTTAISMIMRVLYPNAGTIHIEGLSVASEFTKACTHLGVVTQHNTLWDKLSCRDHLKLFARLRGVPRQRVDAVVEETIEQMELGPYQYRLSEGLSGGMKRKLCVAVAIIGNPDVVMLDEPSAGLDPVSRRNLWSTLIKTMSTRAVLLTTHSMEEAEALCTRIGIMVHGQLEALGSPQYLKQKIGSDYELTLTLDPSKGPVDDLVRSRHCSSFMRELFGESTLLSHNGGVLTFGVPLASMHIGTAFEALEEKYVGLGLSSYSISQPTLEEVFVRTVKSHNKHKEEVTEMEGRAVVGIASSDVERSEEDHPDSDLRNEADILSTGVRKTWLGCSRRVHRTMCIFMALFMISAYLAVVSSDIGYVFFAFVVSFIFCLVGCIGCCCVIPDDPDDKFN